MLPDSLGPYGRLLAYLIAGHHAGLPDWHSTDTGAAARMDEIFSDAAARLTQHPMLGKPGTIPGTRELIPARQLSLGVPDRRRSGVDTDTGSYGPPVRD